MKSIYVKDISKRMTIENEVFLVASKEIAKDKNGRDYMKITLSDKTGRIDGKIWSDSLANVNTKQIVVGNLISITAKVDEYKGIAQLNILDAREIDETVLDEFIESSIYDADEMYQELLQNIEGISHSKLKEILKRLFTDEQVERKFKYWPAARSIHHEFRSGMLQHVLEMLEIAKSMKRFYPNMNYDVLIAGVLLHDIGKIEELGAGLNTTDYTKIGSLYGHITIGAMLFEKFATDLDEDTKMHVTHLILSHHGQLEFGAPVLPATMEAICLHYIDNLSSKAKAAESALKTKNTDTGFTDFNRWLGGVMLWDGGAKTDNQNI